MVDYGFNGYRVPAIPRATRSPRKRCSFKKRGEAKQMCAFDLLATVAGKLLLDKEDSMSNEMNKSMNMNNNNNVKVENQEEDCNKKFFLSGIVLENHDQGVVTSSDSSRNKCESLPCKVEVDPAINTGFGENKRLVNCEMEKTYNSVSHLEDPVVWNEKPPVLASSDSSTKAPSYGDRNLCSSFPVNRDDVNLVSKDDDENSSGCTHPSTIKKSFGSMPRIGDRRIRKILASRCWKVAPKLKDARHSNTESEEDVKPSFWEKNNNYKRLRSERNYPFKKRKFFHYTSLSNSDEGISSEGIARSPEKGTDGNPTGSCQKMNGATGESSSVADQPESFHSRDSHVKLRIKSFRVPELFIEIPETATVGSLKRTVMEAVTAILGNGLRVGVLIQGKKVRDDNKTLLQSGISHDNDSDVLGFSLEPNTKQAPLSFCPGDSHSPPMLQSNSPQPLTSFVESDHDSAPSPTDISTTDSKALIAVPSPLAVVPSHRKSKRSEAVQRRIRRPFSVTEVEALVQAVEKLGTGRWRDVKLRAFDNAKHRTYVDLKDKWKTLVHTARISPQQRRGEPVPQELLDRVLTAHAYWSQQQAKQQMKMQPETCLLF